MKGSVAGRSVGGMLSPHVSATVLAVLLSLTSPALASAAWTAGAVVPHSAGAMWPAAAVNARGDVAVSWIQEGRSHGHATVRVLAAFRAGDGTRFSLRTLVDARDLAARGATVALDARGELTVAWIEQASDAGRWHGHKTVRAAYRSPSGRWSFVRAVGRSAAFNYASPRLAATNTGTVVLTYNGFTSRTSGVVAAWRSRGRPFGSVQFVPVGHDHLLDPTLAVDPRGTAYLTGTLGCTGSAAKVIVAVAPSQRRRFTRRITVDAAPGKVVRMAVMGPETVAMAWLNGRCNTTEDTGGVPRATTLRDGAAAPPVDLGSSAGTGLIVSPALTGAEVSFTTWPSTAPNGTLAVSAVSADGRIEAPRGPVDGWIALAGDPAGDQVVGRPEPAGGVTTPLAARAAGVLESAPVAAVGFPWTGSALAAHDGRALAALSFSPLSSMTPSLMIALWRP